MVSCAPSCGPCYTPAKERLSLFDIEVDRQTGVYQTGETVTGNVRIKVGKEWDINGITIRCFGTAEVKWFIQESACKNNESYIDKKKTVLGAERGKGSANISLRPDDVYKFPFSFRIPESSPMSLEAENGFIRYGITCHIYALIGEDLTLTKIITVANNVDLNDIPEAKVQYQYQMRLVAIYVVDVMDLLQY
ncbi:arrestin domain-containing protein 1-like [Tubulanus polymorphus]|uniref:arrestin domain-containing protein 1-like n=1 Tax=Tubulanus polymorphus TaxID=672921 RepID=UPI003DA5CDF7